MKFRKAIWLLIVVGIGIIVILVSSVMGLNKKEDKSIGIIGGADGPTAIFITGK